MTLKRWAAPFVLALSILLTAGSALAGGLRTGWTIETGVEQLQYEEHEPSLNLDSDAKVVNAIVRVEGLKRWTRWYIAGSAVVPVYSGTDTETWTQGGAVSQTNDLTYGWMRFDGIAGIALHPLFNPFGGFRYSDAKQTRESFVVSGVPVAGTAIEKIRSIFAMAGLRGAGQLAPKWMWHYQLAYLYPLDVTVTNDALPGFEATDDDGYTAEARAGVEYFFGPRSTVGLALFAGQMHWEGSGWLPWAGGSAKWPENDTRFWGGSVNLNYHF